MSHPTAATGLADQRRETRMPAEGEVRIELDDPAPLEFQGRLMDISPRGFRAAHSCSTICSGQLVHFSHSQVSGTARVIWNRIVDQRVETGFLVL